MGKNFGTSPTKNRTPREEKTQICIRVFLPHIRGRVRNGGSWPEAGAIPNEADTGRIACCGREDGRGEVHARRTRTAPASGEGGPQGVGPHSRGVGSGGALDPCRSGHPRGVLCGG